MQEFCLVNRQSTKIFRFEIQRQRNLQEIFKYAPHLKYCFFVKKCRDKNE